MLLEMRLKGPCTHRRVGLSLLSDPIAPEQVSAFDSTGPYCTLRKAIMEPEQGPFNLKSTVVYRESLFRFPVSFPEWTDRQLWLLSTRSATSLAEDAIGDLLAATI